MLISDKCKVRMKYVIQYGSMETLAAIHFNPRVYLLAVLQLATHNHMVANYVCTSTLPLISFLDLREAVSPYSMCGVGVLQSL